PCWSPMPIGCLSWPPFSWLRRSRLDPPPCWPWPPFGWPPPGCLPPGGLFFPPPPLFPPRLSPLPPPVPGLLLPFSPFSPPAAAHRRRVLGLLEQGVDVLEGLVLELAGLVAGVLAGQLVGRRLRVLGDPVGDLLRGLGLAGRPLGLGAELLEGRFREPGNGRN